ncbi:MAG: hypothetical protein IJ217_05000 [Clostridia bacterium]|nr:hypothetical protein [Clostridia bacterium]
MDKRTIFRLVALLIGIFILITFIELGIKALKNRKENSNDVPLVPVINETQQRVEENFVKETNEVVELLNKRDYEAIYSKFTDIYKAAKYPTFNDFTEKMNELIDENSKIEISEMILHSRGYYATILIDGEKELPLTVDNLDSGDMTIMFDRVYMIFEAGKAVGSGNVTMTLEYCLKHLDKVTYTVRIDNDGSREASFSTLNMYEYSTSKLNKNTYDVVKNIEVTVPANSSVRTEIEFPVPSGEMFQPDRLHLNYVLNGQIYEATMDVSFSEQYFSM